MLTWMLVLRALLAALLLGAARAECTDENADCPNCAPPPRTQTRGSHLMRHA